MKNRQWLLRRRPQGEAQESDFELREIEVAPLADGQALIKVHSLSLDPYMRGRMDESKSYAAPQPLGEVMIGATVGEVIDSRNPQYRAGEMVTGPGGWQQYFVSSGSGLQKVDTKSIPASAYLGTLGMPGVTAWYGLKRICQPTAGETVAVSAASGAVGSVVGQLAKLHGCRAVGIAGGKAKCAYVKGELGFDECVDYKSPDFKGALEVATPKGIDCVFENVGGMVFDTELLRMNAFGRIAICGLIAGYSGKEISIRNTRSILVNRLKIEGFIVSEHLELWPQALAELGKLVVEGKLKYRESVAQGIESAPRAFLGMLKGENFGKQIVKM